MKKQPRPPWEDEKQTEKEEHKRKSNPGSP